MAESAAMQARALARKSVASGDPTGWFEDLYAAAERGEAEVPWDGPEPSDLLVDWATASGVTSDGARALVVGCGLGRDAEYIASLGFQVVAFDVSESAVRGARQNHPGTAVDYVPADLFDPPVDWRGAFDFVFESMTIQSLPPDVRGPAIANVASLLAPGGTLLVIAYAWVSDDPPPVGPPWPLPRVELEQFAVGEVDAVRVEDLERDGDPTIHQWRAEFRRPAA